jgi:hypothetical protein
MKQIDCKTYRVIHEVFDKNEFETCPVKWRWMSQFYRVYIKIIPYFHGVLICVACKLHAIYFPWFLLYYVHNEASFILCSAFYGTDELNLLWYRYPIVINVGAVSLISHQFWSKINGKGSTPKGHISRNVF